MTGLVRYGFGFGPVGLDQISEYFRGMITNSLLLQGIHAAGNRPDGQRRLVAVSTVGTGIIVHASLPQGRIV